MVRSPGVLIADGDLVPGRVYPDDGAVLDVAGQQRAPGERLRPHVKAHKCTELARHQRSSGHPGFTCATIREVEGMVAAGLGKDLLLANEVLDASRLGALVAAGARVTVAVDSPATVHAAQRAGLREVLVDVNVGLPRCGCSPDDAGSLAELARGAGLEVRGVMAYEGHTTSSSRRPRRGRYPRWATRSGCCRPTSTPPWLTMSACTWWRVTGSWRPGRWTCGAAEQAWPGSAGHRPSPPGWSSASLPPLS